MMADSNKKTLLTSESKSHDWDNHDELKLKELIIQRQNDIEAQLKEKCSKCESSHAQLLSGMIEVADIILKNTCGIGSNFKLAECDLNLMTVENIRQFYAHVLCVLAYQFGQLIPSDRNKVWEIVDTLIDDQNSGAMWQKKLSTCLDHNTHEYSTVRGGRLLWEAAARLFAIKDWDKNTTARIYYQTAPAQDLVYVMESIENERWATG